MSEPRKPEESPSLPKEAEPRKPEYQNIGACGRIFKEFEICEEIKLDDLCFSGCCMMDEEEEEESDE